MEQRLQAYWTEYLEEVVPTDATALEIARHRASFYAGAASVMFILKNAARSEVPAQHATIRVLYADIEAFCASQAAQVG